MAKPGDKGFCTTKCEYKDTTQGWVCDTHVCVEEAVLAVTVQESGSSSRIINIPLKKGTEVKEGSVLTFSTATKEKDDLNDVAVSGGILPPEYKITVGSDRKLNVFLKSEPTKLITEYIDELTKAKTASNSTGKSARNNAEVAKAELSNAKDNYAAAQKEVADARVAATEASTKEAATRSAAAATEARLTANIATARAETTAARDERAAAQANAAAARALIGPLQIQFAEVSAREQAIQGRLTDAIAAERIARSDLDAATLAHANELASERARLAAEVQVESAAVARERDALARANEAVATLRADLAARPSPAETERINRELATATERARGLETTIASKDADIARTTAELSSVRAESAAAIAGTQRELAELRARTESEAAENQRRVEALTAEKASASGQVEQLERERVEAAEELSRVRANASSSAAARGQVIQFQKRVEDIQRERELAEDRVRAAEARERAAKEALEQEKGAARAEIATAEASLRAEIAALSGQRNAAVSQSESQQLTIQGLSTDLGEARAQADAAARSEEEQRATKDQLEAQIREERTAAEQARAAALAAAATSSATAEETARIRAAAAQAAAASDTKIQQLQQERAAVDASLRAAQAKAGAAEERLARFTTAERPPVDTGAELRAKNDELMAAAQELEEVKAAHRAQLIDLTNTWSDRMRQNSEIMEQQNRTLQSLRALLVYILDELLQQKGSGRGLPAKSVIIGYLGSSVTIDSFKQVITFLLKLPAVPLKFGGSLKNRTVKKRSKNQ